MGIPYYFYSLTKIYNSILIKNLDINADIYCMDFNGIIHPVAAQFLNTDKIIENLWNKIIEYSNLLAPQKVIICVDGVAPLAKIIQQRKRRYLSTYRNKIDNVEIKWDTNAITPGTTFMNKLNIYIKNKIRYNTSNIIYNYSGSDKVGEGEHKIFNILKNVDDDKKIIIHGLDADLIILSLMSHKHHIYLMREQNNELSEAEYNYLDILELRKAIISELINKWSLDKSDYVDIFSDNSKDLIESYCVMCSLLGNDFIPHILNLNLKSNGLEKLINLTGTSINKYGLLILNSVINYKCLTDIFTQLSISEDKDIYNDTEKYLNKKYHNSKLPSEFYAIKNKDSISKEIYSEPSRWKHIYYKELFRTNIYIDSKIIINACSNFIKGIYWTYSYYKYNIIDHSWYYPYIYPPIVKDIANHCIGNSEPVIIKNGDFISNDIQLLIVLPKSSNNLLKKKFKKYTEDIDLGLCHMYPDDYKIRTYLKTHLWECSPVLPKINIKYIENIIK